MELKPHHRIIDLGRIVKLLIVPYGIETAVALRRNGSRPLLLIVPYGIETFRDASKKVAE